MLLYVLFYSSIGSTFIVQKMAERNDSIAESGIISQFVNKIIYLLKVIFN